MIARCGRDGRQGSSGSCRQMLWAVAGCFANLAGHSGRSFLPRYLLMTDVSYQRGVGSPPPKAAIGFRLNSALISQHGQGAVCWQHFLFWKPRGNKSQRLIETLRLIRAARWDSLIRLFFFLVPPPCLLLVGRRSLARQRKGDYRDLLE